MDMETRLAIAEKDIRDHDDILKSINSAVTKISEGMTAMYLSLQKHDSKNEAIDRIFGILEKQQDKMDEISDQLPELRLYNGIVKKAVLGVLAVVGVAILTLVVHKVQ